MIRHKGVSKWEDIDKSNRREQHRDKVTGSEKWCPPPYVALPPQQSTPRQHRRQRKIRERFRRVKNPARVNKYQRMRPAQFPQIKPQRFSCDDKFFRQRKFPLISIRSFE